MPRTRRAELSSKGIPPETRPDDGEHRAGMLCRHGKQPSPRPSGITKRSGLGTVRRTFPPLYPPEARFRQNVWESEAPDLCQKEGPFSRRVACREMVHRKPIRSQINLATQTSATVTESEHAVVQSPKHRPTTAAINAVTKPQAEIVAMGWCSVTASPNDQLSSVNTASAPIKLNCRYFRC